MKFLSSVYIALGILSLTACSIPKDEITPVNYEENPVVTANSNLDEKLRNIGEGAFDAEVLSITDADSLSLTEIAKNEPGKINESGEIKIRLLNVDAPEWTKEKMPYGDQATKRVKELLPVGTKVKVFYDKGNKTDKYGRSLVYLQLDTGELLQQVLLREGLAMTRYVYPPGVTMMPEFKEAEKEARKKRLKIWKVAGYVTTNDGFNPEVIEGPLSTDNLKDTAKEVIGDTVDDTVEKSLNETLGKEGGEAADDLLGDTIEGLISDGLDSILE
ncbi:thermonuclease family protein [Rossellomorea sp. NPDC071047]|uniref:thermonuclease family protein n=1 Tax=Rossellomorea sp. NPDC071047 TaxID=3390675 RepID=UPI003CFCD788